MEWWHALLLGLVEGLTEYLPVSSTGHLILTQHLLRIGGGNAAEAFAICIQAGAIAAVLGLYRGRVAQMCAGLAGKDESGRRLLIHIAAGFFPAMVLGLALEKPIKKYLFGGDTLGMWPIVAAWLVGGIAILVVSAYRKNRKCADAARFGIDELNWKLALIIGCCQCIAMWPGTSRSLVTIVAGVLVGMRLAAAVEFSFLLGVLTLSAATAHDALKHGREMLEVYGPLPLSLGFLAAWISAVLSVKWMVGYLNRHGLALFGWYRIGLAAAVACMIWGGLLTGR